MAKLLIREKNIKGKECGRSPGSLEDCPHLHGIAIAWCGIFRKYVREKHLDDDLGLDGHTIIYYRLPVCLVAEKAGKGRKP